MRLQVSHRLIKIEAVWHSDNIFANVELHWSTLKNLNQTKNLADDNLFGELRVKSQLSSCLLNLSQLSLWGIINFYFGVQIGHIKWTPINFTFLISSPNPMFDHLLESSRWDDSNKQSDIGFSDGMGIIEIEICTLSWALYKRKIIGSLVLRQTFLWGP